MKSLPFRDVLIKFTDLLQSSEIDYAIVGGLAVCYWSEERFTKDIDFTISITREKWDSFYKSISKNPKFITDKIVSDADSEVPYLARIRYESQPIDLIFALTDFQTALLTRKVEVQIQDKHIFIAAAEDIIVLKLIANRTQDINDILQILKACRYLDEKYIRKWAKVWDVYSLYQSLKKKTKKEMK